MHVSGVYSTAQDQWCQDQHVSVSEDCLNMLVAHIDRLAGHQMAGDMKISECLLRDYEVSTVLTVQPKEQVVSYLWMIQTNKGT